MENLLPSIITLISGGALWEVFKFVFPEIKRAVNQQLEAKKTFYEVINPMLKSASELYGKMLSLAKEDFATFINPENSNSSDTELNKKYVYYLFAQFWGQLEYIRQQNHYFAFSKIKKGAQLLKFIETFEARKYRLLDRSIQRIIGENMIIEKDQKFKLMTLHEFLIKYEDSSSSLNKWISELDKKFSNLVDKENRQQILVFGMIISILIDHFDAEHSIIRERPHFKNKLSQKSRSMIKNNLFGYYLEFIQYQERYS